MSDVSRTLLAALVCLLVVSSAGCAGVLDGGTQATEPTATPTATTGTTPATERLAPGLTTDGVTDALALADAHRQAVYSQPFVKHASIERTNGSERAYRQTTIQYANQSHWRWNVTGEGMHVWLGVTNGTFVSYADGDRVLYVVRASGNVSYGVRRVSDDADAPPVPPANVLPSDVSVRDLVYTLFGSDDVTVERGDDAAARVTGSVSNLTLGGASVSNVEFTATVAEDGLVESLELSYERGNRDVERTVAFDQTAGDPVERPGWYSEARNRTT